MQRYKVSKSDQTPPPQYLGGVGKFDVFYWASDYNGAERLIVKWASSGYCFYYWDFADEAWKDSFDQKPGPYDAPSSEDTEIILTMYALFAIKPEKATSDASSA